MFRPVTFQNRTGQCPRVFCSRLVRASSPPQETFQGTATGGTYGGRKNSMNKTPPFYSIKTDIKNHQITEVVSMHTTTRILLIDDEEAVTFGFSKFLDAPGVDVDCAHTLEEVKVCIAAHRYNAAVVDLRLSNSLEMEGLECIRLLRSGQHECKILVLTAFGDNGFREEAEVLGIDFYFEKPVGPEVIRDTLEKSGIYTNEPGESATTVCL
jgi:two-component system, response regulator, stage 0 sporulation protein F